MRICHIIESAGGGSGQVVLDLARHGLDNGDDVTVLYARNRAESKFIDALTVLPGLKTLTSPMQRKVGLGDIKSAWRLFETLKKAGPFDIIHAHSSKAGALARIAGFALPGTVIYTPHCFYSMTPGASRKFYAAIEFILSWLGPKIVLVSQNEFRHARQIKIPRRKLVLIPNGISGGFPVEREQARKNLGVDEDTVVVGFVGRLEAQKNPMRALRAFRRIAGQFPRMRMVMIGDGSLRPAVENGLAEFGLKDRVFLLGQCDARSVIPAFDCLLCSSDFEAMPITFLEALAAGVPIVTTPVGGIEEAVVEGRTGFIARTRDEEGLAAALTRFLNLDIEERRKMMGASFNRAALYTAETMGTKYRELYKSFAV